MDNASRVIQYVGILGYRHSSYGLVDMRIHDINVVCDLSRPNPSYPDDPPPSEDPEETNDLDGTDQSISPQTLSKVDSDLQIAAASVHANWTGPWPLLHYYAFRPDTLALILHMAVDLLQVTTVYHSDSMGATAEDFNNALAVAGFSLAIGLMTYALMITCVVAQNPATGFWGIGAVVLGMLAIGGYAWWVSHGLVDNGQWTAGGAALFFFTLALAYFFIAAGLKKVGGISANVLLGFLGWLLGVSVEAMKAAVVFSVWSRIVFIIMGVLFIVYTAHFLTYGG